MKLSEYRNEEAIEVLADMIEPASEIFSDKAIADGFRNDEKVATIVAKILKNHTRAALNLLAAVKHVPANEYDANIVQIGKDLIEMLSDKELLGFFKSQAAEMAPQSFGDALEITEE